MKRCFVLCLLMFLRSTVPADAAAFVKVSEHFYLYKSSEESRISGAVVTQEAVLLIDPPAPAEVDTMADALRKVTAKPVRWVVHTSYRRELEGGAKQLERQGAIFVGSRELRRLASEHGSAADVGSDNPLKKLAFKQQVRLWPSGLEIRVFALQHKALTGGDVAVFIPADKILVTGDLFQFSAFPAIDSEGGGSASGWVDGLKQVIDAVPLLKQAIPPPKTEPAKPPAAGEPPEEEKTLEELVTVIPGHGPVSNLKEMKELFELAQKFRSDVSRMVAAKRSRQNILASPALSPYREMPNFETFAGLLLDNLAR